jgi:SAM-dependent methyltransferase
MHPEANAVIDRYRRRQRKYSPLDPTVYQSRQELERALIKWLKHLRVLSADELKAFEIGCGSGGVLLQLLRLGFQPQNVVGNELQPELAQKAREMLPTALRILAGDASELDLPDGEFDVVIQSLVLSSILDDSFQQDLAHRMWKLAKPGGGVLSYDFDYNNPSNPDVRAVTLKRIRQLFPNGQITSWRLTLAPPLSRVATRVHPAAYTLLNVFPFLRTHLLCWIAKPYLAS